ncbi:MAG TPA: thioredoxin domain-containing protein [Hyphomonadaceae bacterium]|nr:thioredoxin domain-containing protein [Hyphomonadaceae bacterium]
MPALSIRPSLASAAIGLIAALSLAACGDNGGQTGADGFKPVPVTPVLGDVPLGSADAKVTILEYASLTCPHCRDFWKQDFPRLKTNYIDTGKVRYILRDMPIHGGIDVLLASVSRCKGKDDYYGLIDDLFGAQADIVEAAEKGAAGPIIAKVAESHGLTHDQTRTCIDYAPELKTAIEKAGDEGEARLKAAGVDGRSTPSVFLNDKLITEHNYDALSAQIEHVLTGAPLPATAGPASPTSPATPGPATPAPTTPAPATPASTTPPTPAPQH